MSKEIKLYSNVSGKLLSRDYISRIENIKFGDYSILYEELLLHDVPELDIMIPYDLSHCGIVMRVLKDDGKYYFYPLCDIYFE